LAAAAEADPDGTALLCAGSVLSYRELDAASSRLARLLIGRDVGPGDLVVLAISSSIQSLSAMWAVAKTGAGFVAIDADAPAAHLEHLLSDWRPVIGLAAGAGHPAGCINWLMLDDPAFQRELAGSSYEPVTYEDRLRPIQAGNVAYVTHSFGSTGMVDAVAVTQAEVAAVCARWDDQPLSPGPMTDFLSTVSARRPPVTAPPAGEHFPGPHPGQEHTLVDLFDQAVEKHPDATAVRFGAAASTYRELDIRANRLARKLVALGVGPETLVAVALPRSFDLVVALLATVKAGGGYLPVDPTYPAERIAYLFADAEPVCVVAEAGMSLPATVPTVEIDGIDLSDSDGSRVTEADRSAPLRADNIAYVIYTSGSTGRPKGVPIPHRNVVELFANTQSLFGFDQRDVWTMFHSYAFDFSVWELWGPLLHGGTLVIVDYFTSRSPAQFLELLRTERVTVLNQTPSAFGQLSEADRTAAADLPPLSLRYIVFGGEPLEFRRLDEWHDRHGVSAAKLVNMYGTTETTVHATHRLIGAAEGNGIGGALPGLQIVLLDDRLHPVPVGVRGEIYIAGAQLARGYLGRAGLTAGRFVANPFATDGTRLYRTGDLARLNSDGDLVYLGRADNQVKVRGFRIELGEIETALLALESVQHAAVIVREDSPGDQRIVAYLVGPSDVAAVHTEVARVLPAHMVPAAFVVIDAIPLTTHGKLDRAALPAPTVGTAPFRTPTNPIEQAVADAFTEVLDVPGIGLDDDFFALGGNSLLAFTLQRALSQRLGIELTMATLFDASTVRGLAARITGHGAEAYYPSAIAADAVLGPEFDSAGRAPTHLGPASEVLLTGATGFVGAYLLRELLDRTDARVWCLVRANTEGEAYDRIRGALRSYLLWDDALESRIIAVPGDLADPSFGLTDADYARLADRIDAIYHNGARVNHVEPYARLRAANVEGTREVLRLATTRRIKPVHFVSTTGTVVPAVRSGLIRETARIGADELPAQGYVASKWVAEQLILQAGERGVPVRVYRLGLVSGDLRIGVNSPDDSFWNMIRAAAILGVAPDIGDAATALIPVTYVTRAIVEISLGDATDIAYHLINEKPVAIRDIFECLGHHGLPVETEAVDTIQLRLSHEAHTRNAAGDDSLVRAALLIGNYANITTDIGWDDTNTRNALAHSGIHCPTIDETAIDTYITAFIASGFLPTPNRTTGGPGQPVDRRARAWSASQIPQDIGEHVDAVGEQASPMTSGGSRRMTLP
jgi:amino acid adenylation domain-containing protein/thioester reductase-like protein